LSGLFCASCVVLFTTFVFDASARVHASKTTKHRVHAHTTIQIYSCMRSRACTLQAIIVSADIAPIDVANATSDSDIRNATACTDGNNTDGNNRSCREEGGGARFKAPTMCRARSAISGTSSAQRPGAGTRVRNVDLGEMSFSRAGEETDAPLRNPQTMLSPVGFSCAPNQTLILSKPGERQQCCSLQKNGGLLGGHVCRRWTIRPDRGVAHGLEVGSSGLVCELLMEASSEWEHDCGIRACCVDTEVLLSAMHLKDLAAVAQTEDSGCYTTLPQTYVGEDDLSHPPPIKTCSLPHGTLLTTTFRRTFKTLLLEAMLQEFPTIPILEESLNTTTQAMLHGIPPLLNESNSVLEQALLEGIPPLLEASNSAQNQAILEAIPALLDASNSDQNEALQRAIPSLLHEEFKTWKDWWHDPIRRRRLLQFQGSAASPLELEEEDASTRRRSRIAPLLEKLFLRDESSTEADSNDTDGGNVTSGNSTDSGGNAGTGEEEGDDVEITCREHTVEEPPIVVPVWASTCGNEFGFPLFLKPGPRAYAEFHVLFTEPTGPITHQQLSKLVQLTSFMVGVHKSERHLISVRQMLHTSTNELRAVVRISTPCPAGAIELRRLIKDRLQALGTGASDGDSNSTNASAAEGNENAEQGECTCTSVRLQVAGSVSTVVSVWGWWRRLCYCCQNRAYSTLIASI
jgi:hypothetical protein